MSERPHTIEAIRDHWLRNRSADGTDWQQALGAVYDLAVAGERARLREKVAALLPARLRMVRPRVGGVFDDRPSIRFQAAEEGFEHALAEVLALLAEKEEPL